MGCGRSRGRRVTPIRTRILTSEYLRAREEIERGGVSGLVEVLRKESIDLPRARSMEYRDGTATTPLSPGGAGAPPNRSVKAERWVRIEKIIATILYEAH